MSKLTKQVRRDIVWKSIGPTLLIVVVIAILLWHIIEITLKGLADMAEIDPNSIFITYTTWIVFPLLTGLCLQWTYKRLKKMVRVKIIHEYRIKLKEE